MFVLWPDRQSLFLTLLGYKNMSDDGLQVVVEAPSNKMNFVGPSQ